MDTQISFTIPLDDADALNRVSLMLSGLAMDASKETPTDKPESVLVAKQETIHQPAATTVAETALTVVAAGVELDAEGLPWDARIHSSGKMKTKKEQTWKIARNMDKAKVAAVKQELRELMAIPAPETVETIMVNTGPGVVEEIPVTPPTPPAPEAATPPPPPEAVEEVEEEIVYLHEGKEYDFDQLQAGGWSDQQIAGLETITRSVAAAPVASGLTFPALSKKITAAITARTLTQDDVNNALQANGIEALPLLISRPDLFPVIDAALF